MVLIPITELIPESNHVQIQFLFTRIDGFNLTNFINHLTLVCTHSFVSSISSFLLELQLQILHMPIPSKV
jgi:hypothetical protein